MATFVEQAVLKLTDQTSAPANKINASLNRLFATANKLNKLDVRINARATGIDRIEAQFRAATRAINSHNAALRRTGSGGSGRGSVPAIPALGGSGGNRPPPNNLFQWRGSDGNFEAAGRIMARSFVAVAGVGIAAAVNRIIRGTGAAAEDIDTTRAAARASGGDVAALEQAAFRAAGATLGISGNDIMAASIEQAAALKAQRDAGTMTVEQFNRQLDALTARVATTAARMGTLTGDFRKGAEDARQNEKAIVLTAAGLDTKLQQAFAEAITKAQIASGGDVTAAEIKRMLQQFGPGFASQLSPEGVARLALVRDEGGRQSTADLRTLVRDLTRGDLNKRDFGQQLAAGLRDANKSTTLSTNDFKDPINLIEKQFLSRARNAGIDVNDVSKLISYYDNTLGVTTKAAEVAAAYSAKIEQNRIELQKFRDTRPAELDRPTIASAKAEVKASAIDAAAKALTPLIEPAKSALGGIGGFFTGLSQGFLPGGAKAGPGAQAAAAGSIALAAAIAPSLKDALTPLNASGLLLGKSALALDGAAAALTRAAVAQGAGGAAGTAGAAAGAAGGFLRGALRYAGWAGVAAVAAGLANDLYQKGFRGDRFLSKPGDRAKLAQDERNELAASIQRLEKQIADNRARERLPGTSDVINQPLQQRLAEERLKLRESDEMIAKWSATWKLGGESIDASLVAGAAKLSAGLDSGIATGAAKLAGGVAEAGSTIQSAMTAGAGAAAEIIRAAMSNVSVTAKLAAGPNVGTTKTND